LSSRREKADADRVDTEAAAAVVDETSTATSAARGVISPEIVGAEMAVDIGIGVDREIDDETDPDLETDLATDDVIEAVIDLATDPEIVRVLEIDIDPETEALIEAPRGTRDATEAKTRAAGK
jgi:hypothetical protein